MPSSDYLVAISALAGTFVGGITSIAATWLGSHHQSREKRRFREIVRRQSLYKRFIRSASTLYAEALEREKTTVPAFVEAYATIHLMRMASTRKVVEEAENALRRIAETYLKEKASFPELIHSFERDIPDVLRDFAEACRQELE